MKHCIVLIIALFIFSSESHSSVSNIIGMAVSEPGIQILCDEPSFCSRIITPDWTDQNRFYGSNGIECRISENKGRTWRNCPSNPSTTAYFHYAVTRSGFVLAAANDNGGTEIRIRRSTDQARTWNTVYSSIPVDTGTYSLNGRLRCSRTTDVCTLLYFNGSTPNELISNDQGATWALNPFGAIGTVIQQDSHLSFANNATGAIYGPKSSNGFSDNRSLTWNGTNWVRSSIWPTTAGGQCNWTYIDNGLNRAICHVGSSGTTYEVRDQNGSILNTFSMPGVPSDNGSTEGLAISMFPGEVWMLRKDTAGSTGIWYSGNSGSSFIKKYTVNKSGSGIGTQGSIFQGLDNCFYASWVLPSLNSTVIRVCY